MRSQDIQEVALYSYISPEQRVPADHPLRPIREMVNIALHKIRKTSDTESTTMRRHSCCGSQ